MFLNKNKDLKENSNLIKVGALLIHAAKIDQDYSNEEELIITEMLIKIGANSQNISNIIQKSKEMEENSNQILEFTKEVKNMSEENKIMIIETLWRIIFSNKKADIYETNLMRRLAGLLYIDNKIMGDIKYKIEKENSK